MKIIKNIILVLAVIASTCCFTIKADASTTMKVNASDNIAVGETFKATITVNSSSKMTKYQYTLNYDESNLELVSGQPTITWEGAGIKTSTKTFSFKLLKSSETLLTIKNYSINLENGTLIDGNKITITGKTIKPSTKTTTKTETTTSKKEEDPILVTINNKEYTVVTDEEELKELKPDEYKEITIEINGKEVPAFYSETTRFTLVALKDEEGKIRLYIYNKSKETYKYYNIFNFEGINFLPLNASKKSIPDGYTKEIITINNKKVTAYKNTENPKYYLVYGMNLNTGKKGWYSYEPTEQTLQKYYSLKMEDEDDIIILALAGGLVLLLFINVIALCVKVSNNKKKKRKIK